MDNPRDTLAAVLAPVESLGGKLLHVFFSEDAYHVLAIAEIPDPVSRAELTIALYASGAVAQVHTSQLLTASEAREARQASGNHSRHRNPDSRALAASAS